MQVSETKHSNEEQGVEWYRVLVDPNGRKRAVVIDLKKHRELWEDIDNVLVSESREHERSYPLYKVEAELIKCGKLRR